MYIHHLKIRKTTEHNEKEQSEFSIKNIIQAAQSFFSLNCFKFKEICAVTEQETICLLRQNNLETYPRNVMIQNIPDIQTPELYTECQQTAFLLYEELVKLQQKAYTEHMEQMIESSGARMERKQPLVQFTKEIKKKMNICKKFFMDSRMEGYDFREVDLSNAVFMNCSLIGANFSFVNLENTAFINCNLTNVIWHKAWTNNTVVIDGTEQYLTNLIKGEVYGKE
ncbi:pentapeptide repeat-containing protein [Lachnospiraceae bacterium 48-33]